MAEPFLSEVKIVAFNFPPRGWAQCDGQILPIQQYQALYSLLGTTYGGDGRTTFALPDLRGRAAVHPGANGVDGEGVNGGEETHILTTQEIAAHNHPFSGFADDAQEDTVAGSRPARAEANAYHASGGVVQMGDNSVGWAGSGQGHDNMQPYLVVNFVIALQGSFPSRN